MPIYIRFENNKQIEVTVLENKPKDENWYEAPENFDWQRGISVVEMAKIIQEKVRKAKKAIIKCEELEDIAKKKIEEAKSEKELQALLNDFKQEIQKVLAD